MLTDSRPATVGASSGNTGVSFNGRGHREQLLLGGRWLRLAAEYRAGPHPFRALAHVALSLAHPRLPIHLHRSTHEGVGVAGAG